MGSASVAIHIEPHEQRAEGRLVGVERAGDLLHDDPRLGRRSFFGWFAGVGLPFECGNPFVKNFANTASQNKYIAVKLHGYLCSNLHTCIKYLERFVMNTQ